MSDSYNVDRPGANVERAVYVGTGIFTIFRIRKGLKQYQPNFIDVLYPYCLIGLVLYLLFAASK